MKLSEHLKHKEELIGPIYDLNLLDFMERMERWLRWGLDTTPAYHRGHVWDAKERESYIEYLLFGGCCSVILWY